MVSMSSTSSPSDQDQQALVWLEPLMMVVLGVVMGGLVLALYLPVFQLGQVL
jgi:type II secretory pathway component PulF